MALVTTASCSILLNGSPSRTFKPSRGLRQGDPLSPFLFILMIEGLGRAIRATKEEWRIQGLRLTQGGDTVTHQQSVDDTMLQGTPTAKEAKALKQILSDFARATGIEVSLIKSKILFFNTDISIQRNISRILGFQRESLPMKDLGVPLTDKPLHKDIWEPVLNKLKDKISKWTNRALKLAKKLKDNLRSEELADIHTDTINKALRWVSDYWDQSRNNGKWRTWKLPDYREMGMLHTQAIALKGLLNKRQILKSDLDDQLIWGRNKAGLFNLREAKRIDAGFNLSNTDKTWKEIWENPHWMKVKLFKWLVHQGKILIWDNLKQKGFVGPSRCHLCRQQEKTTNHLLNRCTFNTTLWNWVGEVFEQIDRDAKDIITTLKNWRKHFSDNEIINSAWMLTLGFLIWNVWKEHNNRIFKEKVSPVSNILKLLLKQLKETVHILGGAATYKPIE
eukprot:PITA_22782